MVDGGEIIVETMSIEGNIYRFYSMRRRSKVPIVGLENKGFSGRKGKKGTIKIY